MIVVRPFEEQDRAAIDAMKQAQGFGYDAPDWGKMLASSVIEIDHRPAMAAFLRKTAETYLLFDPREHFRRRERLGQLLILHKELRGPLLREGLTDIHCWLPPKVKDFGATLENQAFGWAKAPWPDCYVKEVR